MTSESARDSHEEHTKDNNRTSSRTSARPRSEHSSQSVNPAQSAPPSFTPSRTRQSSAPAASTSASSSPKSTSSSSSIPRSFTPQQRGQQQRSSENTSQHSSSSPHSASPSGSTSAPSFAPRTTRASSSRVPQEHTVNSSAHASTPPRHSAPVPSASPDAPSAPPAFAPAARSTARSTAQNAQNSRPQMATHTRELPRNGYNSARSSRAHSQFAPSRAHGYSSDSSSNGQRAHRVPLGRILSTIILVLLVISVAFSAWTWGWVGSHLNRKIPLSGAADTSPASTWLILGSDMRDGTDNTGSADSITGFRTDTILVLTKPVSGPASLISIPRDSYVEVDGVGMKINGVAELYDYNTLIRVVERITNYKIDHVTQIGFSGVEKIVNTLGGVELCYDATVSDKYSGLNWQAGCHIADGSTALAFARMRYEDPEGDIGRAKRQRQVIGAIMKKAAKPSTLINVPHAFKVASDTLSVIQVDDKADTFSMLTMALAFKEASSAQGVNGSVYYNDVDYRPNYNIGSSVRLDVEKNNQLFKQAQDGGLQVGTRVGGYTG